MCDEWANSLSGNQVFKGGEVPNLADLVKILICDSFNFNYD